MSSAGAEMQHSRFCAQILNFFVKQLSVWQALCMWCTRERDCASEMLCEFEWIVNIKETIDMFPWSEIVDEGPDVFDSSNEQSLFDIQLLFDQFLVANCIVENGDAIPIESKVFEQFRFDISVRANLCLERLLTLENAVSQPSGSSEYVAKDLLQACVALRTVPIVSSAFWWAKRLRAPCLPSHLAASSSSSSYIGVVLPHSNDEHQEAAFGKFAQHVSESLMSVDVCNDGGIRMLRVLPGRERPEKSLITLATLLKMSPHGNNWKPFSGANLPTSHGIPLDNIDKELPSATSISFYRCADSVVVKKMRVVIVRVIGQLLEHISAIVGGLLNDRIPLSLFVNIHRLPTGITLATLNPLMLLSLENILLNWRTLGITIAPRHLFNSWFVRQLWANIAEIDLKAWVVTQLIRNCGRLICVLMYGTKAMDFTDNVAHGEYPVDMFMCTSWLTEDFYLPEAIELVRKLYGGNVCDPCELRYLFSAGLSHWLARENDTPLLDEFFDSAHQPPLVCTPSVEHYEQLLQTRVANRILRGLAEHAENVVYVNVPRLSRGDAAYRSELFVWTDAFQTFNMTLQDAVPSIRYVGEPANGISLTRRFLSEVVLEYARHQHSLLKYDEQRGMVELDDTRVRSNPSSMQQLCQQCAASNVVVPAGAHSRCALEKIHDEAALRAALLFVMFGLSAPFIFGPLLISALIDGSYQSFNLAQLRWLCEPNPLNFIRDADDDEDEDDNRKMCKRWFEPTYAETVQMRYITAYTSVQVVLQPYTSVLSVLQWRARLASVANRIALCDAFSMWINGGIYSELFHDFRGTDSTLRIDLLAAALIGICGIDQPTSDMETRVIASFVEYFQTNRRRRVSVSIVDNDSWSVIDESTAPLRNVPWPFMVSETADNQEEEWFNVAQSRDGGIFSMWFSRHWRTIFEELLTELRERARLRASSDIEFPKAEEKFCTVLERMTKRALMARMASFFIAYILECNEAKLQQLYETLTNNITMSPILLVKARRPEVQKCLRTLRETYRQTLQCLRRDDFDVFYAPRLTVDRKFMAVAVDLCNQFNCPRSIAVKLLINFFVPLDTDAQVRLPVVGTCARELTISCYYDYARFVAHMDTLLLQQNTFSLA